MSGLSQNETATGGLFAAPARAGFVNWVNDTLGIERTANVLWDMEAEEFDFRIYRATRGHAPSRNPHFRTISAQQDGDDWSGNRPYRMAEIKMGAGFGLGVASPIWRTPPFTRGRLRWR